MLGWPVAHSRSPAMHNAALAELGLADWRYQRLPVPPELFVETTRALSGVGFLGANVTIPHKEAALALADRASGAAAAIGAANTLSFAPDGTISADNTDAPGLLAALSWSPAGMSAMVLGAGGSARAVVWALVGAGAREVLIWNRTAARAHDLAARFGARAVARPTACDMLINCTSVGLGHASSQATVLKRWGLAHDDLSKYPYVVDLVYGEPASPLLRAARERGAQATVDGLEILVRQGALSFQIWIGDAAPLQTMRDAASRATP